MDYRVFNVEYGAKGSFQTGYFVNVNGTDDDDAIKFLGKVLTESERTELVV